MGKYVRRKKRSFKPVLVLASVAILVLGATFGTLAYLNAESDQVNNTFTPSHVTSEVLEKEDENNPGKKIDVCVQNTGDTTAYIRASVVITWQAEGENGKVLICPEKPVAGIDYTVSLNTGDTGDWFLGSDGFYYYKGTVEADGETTNLINSIAPVNENTPEGYGLCVEILCSAIQAEPEKAVESAWPAVEVGADGQLAEKSVG